MVYCIMESTRKTLYGESKYCLEEEKEKDVNEIDKLKRYIHDIRNSKLFSKDMLVDVNNLSYENRMVILTTYNQMISYYVSLLYEG